MKKAPLGMLFALACVPILAIPVLASATPKVGEKQNGLSQCDEHYVRQHAALIYDQGQDAAGRNYVREGLLGSREKSEPVTNARACQEAAELRTQLPKYAPEPAPTASTTSDVVASTPVTSSVTPVASAGGCPASMAGEASYPTQYNATGSGASGCYQIMPGTWALYGDPAYEDAAHAPMDVQTEAMGRICAAQGNDAWVAADPC